MEQGYFHPTIGYWQASGTAGQDFAASYPEGTVQVPLRPSADHQWQGGMWVYVAPPAPPPVALNKTQWSFLLDLTGFRAVVDAALAALPKGSPEEIAQWAGMKAVAYESSEFTQHVTLVLAAQIRAMGIPGLAIPSDAEIQAAWPIAVAFEGAASLGVV